MKHPNAPFSASRYICPVCSYVFDGSLQEFKQLPDHWRCPICGVKKSMFKIF